MPSCEQPETIYIKENPCCVLIRAIEDCEDIGSSLANIQFNFSNLDAHTCNLEMSAVQLWNPTSALIAEMSAKWQAAYNIVQTMSAAWDAAYTTVSQYSAAFIEPVTVIYPSVFATDTVSTAISVLSSWVNANYPVTSNSVGSDCTVINYAPNQKLWLYCAIQTYTTQTILAQGTATVSNIYTAMHVWHQNSSTGEGYCQTLGPPRTAADGTMLPPTPSGNLGAQWVTKLVRPFVPFVNSELNNNTTMSWGGGWVAGAAWDQVKYDIVNPQVTGTYYDNYVNKFAWVEFQCIGGVWTYMSRYY